LRPPPTDTGGVEQVAMNGAPPRLATALSCRYRIERRLGAGGMATVYLAADVRHDGKVTLEVIPRATADGL
jgi:hypothetical protein